MAFDAYFVRHVESAGNAGLATDSPDSIPLTERGCQQAAELADTFPVEPAIIAWSPFLRARLTAEPLRARFPSARSVELPIHEFTYLATSAWRGSTAGDRRPAADAYWQRADHTYCDGEGAETFEAFFARIDTCLQWLHEQPAQPIVLICHEFFIRGVLWHCLAPSRQHVLAGMIAFRAWQLAAPLPNASITRISCDSVGRVTLTPPFLLQSSS